MFDRALKDTGPGADTFFFARFLGLRFTYDDYRAWVDVPVAPHMYNGRGYLHGGIILLIFDVAMGHLCRHFLGSCVTLELKGQFFRPVLGPCRCEARIVRDGRKIVYTEAKLLDEHGSLVAAATATMMRAADGAPRQSAS